MNTSPATSTGIALYKLMFGIDPRNPTAEEVVPMLSWNRRVLSTSEGEKSKEKGNKVNGSNVTPKPATEKNVITQDLACQRKPATPMNLGTSARIRKEGDHRFRNGSFISDVEEISEDDSTLTRAELQEKLARTQKKLLSLSALKQPKSQFNGVPDSVQQELSPNPRGNVK
ncbi:unnamed protein product [Orchesella dallaii]|uniref:Uncharacterized protein n=1 Tax=Orchesella dallaii TaxID=48710 RepID=A0ABP1RL95_9HEXA